MRKPQAILQSIQPSQTKPSKSMLKNAHAIVFAQPEGQPKIQLPSPTSLPNNFNIVEVDETYHVHVIVENKILVLEKDGEKTVLYNLKGLVHLTNMALTKGNLKDTDAAVEFLEIMSEAFSRLNSKEKTKDIVLCARCGYFIGVKMCSGCPKGSQTRYCSRACQLDAWPLHKMTCNGHKKGK